MVGGGNIMEYILYCDESSSQGDKYTDFYGGCIVDGRYLSAIENKLNLKKKDLNLNNEIKWVKVTENYLNKYIEIIDLFFQFVEEGKIKIRIMFRKKEKYVNLFNSAEDKYFKLYYQFIKHSFGLKYIPKSSPANVRIYVDQLPDRKDKCEKFKRFLYDMQRTNFFYNSGLRIKLEDIVEIDSKKHVIQQCVDIILGAMYFKLNGLNKIIPEGQRRRGKRTIAKEKLYKHIHDKITRLLPEFNIGISTGTRGFEKPHWESPYEHWLFNSEQITKLDHEADKDIND